jgi:hypothetical protein
MWSSIGMVDFGQEIPNGEDWSRRSEKSEENDVVDALVP